jgi:hypothetical protein
MHWVSVKIAENTYISCICFLIENTVCSCFPRFWEKPTTFTTPPHYWQHWDHFFSWVESSQIASKALVSAMAINFKRSLRTVIIKSVSHWTIHSEYVQPVLSKSTLTTSSLYSLRRGLRFTATSEVGLLRSWIKQNSYKCGERINGRSSTLHLLNNYFTTT